MAIPCAILISTGHHHLETIPHHKIQPVKTCGTHRMMKHFPALPLTVKRNVAHVGCMVWGLPHFVAAATTTASVLPLYNWQTFGAAAAAAAEDQPPEDGIKLFALRTRRRRCFFALRSFPRALQSFKSLVITFTAATPLNIL